MRKSEENRSAARPNTDAAARQGEPELASVESATIMMVDDEPTTLDVMEMFLLAEGYQRFLKCTEASQVIGELQAREPDLLLLNLLMPEMDGLEILDCMQADERLRGIPVVIVTSSTDAETKQTALEHGATEFLHKPVDPSELVLRVRNTLAAKILREVGAARSSHAPLSVDTDSPLPDGDPNAQRLVSTLDGRGTRWRKIIATFVERLNDKLLEMEACFAAGDSAELMNLAHWLKGAAGTVGFDAFTLPAEELSDLVANHKEDEIEDAIRKISDLADRIAISDGCDD